jgi:hypothetical protein
MKIKIGPVFISRRMYLTYWWVGFLMWVLIGLAVGTYLAPGTSLGDDLRRDVPWLVRFWPCFYWGAISTGLVEAAVILRRFRTRREFVRREGLSVDDVGQP